MPAPDPTPQTPQPFAPPAAPASTRVTLILLWLVFYASFTLFTPPLLDDADSVHAEVAREMLLRHDWVTLYANGIRYLEKAPLYYWSMAASMKLLGPTTAASRIPLALAVLALALLLESFARRAFANLAFAGTRAGLYTGLIVFSSFGIFIFSRINIPDVLVCFWLTLALFAYFLTEQSDSPPSRPLCFLFAIACALNILTKGLIGIVFPLGIVLIHLLATRGLRPTFTRIRQFHPLSSIALFLAIAVPWHILAALANPGHGHPSALTRIDGHLQVPYPTDGNVHGWAWFYFINEQLYRYLNLRIPHDYDTAPLLVFYGLILVWLMPWSAFLFPALTHAIPLRLPAFRTRLRTLTLTPLERTQLLLLLWAAIPLIFFSLSTRQEYYVLPSLPPMILLIATFLARPVQGGLSHFAEGGGPVSVFQRSATTTRISGLLAILGIVIAVICLTLIVRAGTPAPDTDLSTLLQQNPGDYALSFGHFLDLNTRALGLFRLPLALTAFAFGLGLPAAFLFRRSHRSQASIFTLTASAFFFLLAAHLGLRTFSPTLTSYQLAKVIAPQLHAEDLIVLHGEYESGSTLGFYLRRNDLHIVEGRSSNLWYGSFFPDAPNIFETRDSIAKRWPGPQRIFLWQDPHDSERPILQLPAPVYVLASSGGKQILSNQPNR